MIENINMLAKDFFSEFRNSKARPARNAIADIRNNSHNLLFDNPQNTKLTVRTETVYNYEVYDEVCSTYVLRIRRPSNEGLL